MILWRNIAVIDEKKLIDELHELREKLRGKYARAYDLGLMTGIDKAIELAVQADKIEDDLDEKRIPKQVEKATREEYEETGYTHVCPTCGQFVGTRLQSCGIQYGIEENDYCCSCGQRLKWSDDND